MTKRTPYRGEIVSFIDDYAPLMVELEAGIRAGLAKGETVGALVNRLVVELGVVESLRKQLLVRIEATFSANGGTTAKAFRKTWLNTKWPGDKLTLSQRTLQYGKMAELKDSLRTSMRNQKTWLQTAEGLSEQALIRGDVAGHIQELDFKARMAFSGNDPKALREYQKQLRKSKAQIARLAANDAPNTQLKKEYQQVINATESGSVAALDTAISKAVSAKAQYNAERIARTEIAKAYGQGHYQEALSNSDVIGLRWDLSSRHKITDVCDFHAEANLYGMGAGTYPKDSVPPYPAHPNCLCVLSDVFRDEVKPKGKDDFSEDKAKAYLERQPEYKKRAMLTVKGAKEFNRNANSWKANLRQWNGNQSMRSLVKVK